LASLKPREYISQALPTEPRYSGIRSVITKILYSEGRNSYSEKWLSAIDTGRHTGERSVGDRTVPGPR